MAAPSSSRRSKRNMAASVSEPLAKSSKVTLLSPSLLLLEIPSDTNTSLPIWDAMRAQHVDVTWTVNPYSVSVHFTPKTSKPDREGTSAVAKPSFGSSNVLQPHMVIQSITPLHDTSQNTTRVLLTFSQNTTQIFAGQQQKRPLQPEPATSFIFSLPLIITQPQPVHQPTASTTGKPPLPTIQTPKTPPPIAPVPTPYHTKSCPDVLICDDFLLNKCLAGKKCKLHHTPYPFHWQLWNVFTQEWVDFPIHAQALLERIYCDVEKDVVTIKDGRDRYTLTFDIMEVDDPSIYDGVRRLTNSDAPERNSYFPSSWKIYWWNNTTWKEYDENISTLLRKAMQDKEPECSFYISSQAYKVDFTTMSQTNVTTGFLRDVRWRPVYRSPASMMPHLQTGIQIEPPESATGPLGGNFRVDPLEDFSTWYPPVWHLSSQEEEYSLVDVPMGTKAYQSIQSLFYQSLPDTKVDIVSIQQVQNLLHWDKYQR
ncbi:mono-ADP-ribosyltransferase TIPARP-like isoform X1 [Solea senegalensis]|nr:mono-ADP-ribosyltransferase TIPARP-like isoform X1 [Solea senegalensis]